ncbi:MAG: radical SAM family uncharacterized protein/radical SAM-linked protein [Polyangiales bacterium]|jgi:radical SAM family uncharacterized protein/radical SAM-linked protein
MDVRNHPYADFLHEVKKPAQYIGGEHGEKRKDWDDVSCRLCLAFPDLYEIGMSHLGFKILYGIVNGHEKLLAERAYAPWADMEEKLREKGQPLRSLESWKPLSDFDIVGFSLQFELTYSNVLTMLDLGGIPLRSADRGDSDPLVVCGGPVATHAQPLAGFIDVFLIGDGEEKTAELMLAWAQLRDAGVPRRERLIAIAQLGGFYVPSLYDTVLDEDTQLYVVEKAQEGTDAPFPVERAIVRDLKKFDFPHDGPVAATETIFDRVSIEVARGCTEGCRFCQAGMIYRPVRERDPKAIVDTIVRAVKEGGYDEASLTSLSTADYSAIEPLVHDVMQALKGERVSVSVSSLRAYGLSEAVLDDMKTQRAGGLTFAPEAGTQRMRDVVNKNVTEEQLMETAERVFSRGWTKMKLYFMIGLPTEEDEDVIGIAQTGARALEVANRVRKRRDAKVTVSVSSHVPKPHTPFQWCAMDSHEEIVRKQGLLRQETRMSKVSLRVHESSGSWLEGVLARGDHRLSDVIEGAWRKGARFDSWQECLDLEAWEGAFADAGIDPHGMLGTLPVSGRLPWDHIDVGLEEGFLAKEYRKALKNRLSPPCGKVAGSFVHHTNLEDANADSKRLVCYDCGVACDMGKMRNDRLISLDRLGAKTPRTAPSLARIEAGDTEAERIADDLRQSPKGVVEQGPPLRLRIGFSKVGRIAFSSHLDLVRLFPRWFRRAELPMFWSEGFHPRPQMMFSPALSLGMSSTGEYVDVKVRRDDFDGDFEALLPRLRETAFEGIEVFGAVALGDSDKALGRILNESVWVAALPVKALAERGLGTEGELRAFVETKLGGKLIAVRERKGIKRNIDVSRALVDCEVGEGLKTLRAAGLVGDFHSLRFTTDMAAAGTAKPTEVLRALFDDLPSRLVREGVFARAEGRRVSPLDIDTLRRAAIEVSALKNGPKKSELIV